MIQEITSGIFTSPTMPYTPTICAACGKEFHRFRGWIYKSGIGGGGHQTKYYCSYHCWPASGLLNEGKYNDAKIRQQVQKSEKMHKEKYHESRKAYRLAHRKEISARQNARYNNGSPEAEAARLERNRKAREKKKQKDVEKWKGEEK